MKIAIRGHKSRGKEIIQIFKDLGTEGLMDHTGSHIDWVYLRDDSLCYKKLIVGTDISFLKGHGYKIYTLEEFEREFPFKVGDIVQTKQCGEPAEVIKLYPNPACVISYKVRYKSGKEMQHCPENIKFYKEMKEERNITLTLDKAKEWYKKGGELKEIALQAFTEQELNPLPRSWEEYCRKYEYTCLSTRYTNIPLKYDALLKLEQLRNCWWNGWKPEWNNCEKYIIKWDKDDLIVFTARNIRAFLVFPTREMAYEFLKCFRYLIEQARDLI